MSGDFEAADEEYALAAELDPNIPKLVVYQAEVRDRLLYERSPTAEE